jgi:hypothetical protein
MNKLNMINTIPTIHKSSGKWVLAAAFTVTLLAGCGSGGGDDGSGSGGGGAATQARGIDQNVSDLIVYMKGLIALDENSEVVDINPLTLAVDNAGEAAPL